MYLSKSKYCQLWQCPKILWMEANRRELKKDDPALRARAATGDEVGDLAMGYFGDFTEVTVKHDGKLDIPAMIRRTKECMDAGVENICEASFSYDGLYCAVDILHREGDGYAIYEVKSASEVSEVYGIDIAYQKYVLERCGVRVTGTYLLHINSDYVRGEELDLKQLFTAVDMTEAVAAETPNIPARLEQAKAVLAGGEPDDDIGPHCDDPYKCAYWDYCARHLPKPNVFDLYRMSGKKKWEHYRNGLVSFEDVAGKVKLNEKQTRQVDFALNDRGTHTDPKAIRKFLNTLSYPIYFLDFETMQLAIPQFPGTKPYAQIPFQYSLHYIETPGGKLEWKDFLAVSGTDPRRAIAESLCRDIPMNVCVTAYNKAFECTRLKELAEWYPDLAEHLLNIRDNIKDLLDPFQGGDYYNRAMGGSFSIKSVLPALFPDDETLNYKKLDQVHNGTEAMTVFPKIKDMTEEEQERASENLRAYCHLDTLAMVKVWEKLEEAAE